VSETEHVSSEGGPQPWPQAGVETLPRTAIPTDHPEDFATYDGLAPNAAWVAGGAGSGESRYGLIRLALLVAAVIAGTVLFGPYVFIIIGGLLVSIALHEFGHYWTAKRCGMKVTEYFIGFGPRLFSFRRGETEYGFKLIPAGAYVRIVGMHNLEEVGPGDEPRTYRQQGTFKRMAVVLAGPFMNILIAFVLIFAMFLLQGAPTDKWFVATVLPGQSASIAGMQSGDMITAIDGEPVGDFDGFRKQLDAKAGRQVKLGVDRQGQSVVLTPTLGWRFNAAGMAAVAAKPALWEGDIITGENGQTDTTPAYEDLRRQLAQPGPPVNVRIDRQGHAYDLLLNRPMTIPADGASGFLGVKQESVLQKESPVGAAGETTRAMARVVGLTGSSFGRLFSPAGLTDYSKQVIDSAHSTTTLVAPEGNALVPVGSSPPAESVKPGSQSVRPISIVGIVQAGTGAAEAGIWDFLLLLATVNLALAIINLLPLLPFDGGHAVIAGYEGIRGRIRGQRYYADLTKMMPVVYGVVGLLLLLGTSSILMDIMRPVSFTP